MIKLNDIFDEIYVINLKSRKDRLKHIENESKKHSFKFKRINAINGDDLTKKELSKIKDINDLGWNKYAYSLLKTTLNILDEAKKNNHKNILILEDDNVFIDNLSKHLDEIKNFIKNNDWIMFKFCADGRDKGPVSKHIFEIKQTVFCNSYALNINHIDLIKTALEKMDKPLDILLHEIEFKGGCFRYRPNLSYQIESFSNIRNKVMNYII